MSVEGLDTVEAVEGRARWLFGGAFEKEGVIHPTACVRKADGAYCALRIEPRTPKSPHDLFALFFQRARADVIVSTGAILRAEPDVRYDLADSPFGPGLLAYRASLGKTEPPRVVVLSRRLDLASEHPALRAPQVELWSPQPLSGLGHRPFTGRPVEAVETLRAEGGLVVVEAGPSVTRGLHAADAIDALYLTTFAGEIDEALLAGAAFDTAGIETRLPAAGPPRRVEEPSGPWHFVRRSR